MERYLSNWITIIDGIKNDNTYKASWGKAIIECIVNEEYQEVNGEIVVEEYFVVQKILKYYWNLNCFFNVTQGDFLVIEKVTKEIKEDFYRKKKHTNPAWSNEMEIYIKRKQIKYEKIINRIMKIVNRNIAYRFLNHKSKRIKLYKLDIKTKSLRFKKSDIEIINNYSGLLNDLINFKWASYLENYNNSPYLLKKVIDSSQVFLKRQSLRSIKNLLIEYYHNEGIVDFYTGKHIDYTEIKVVHVIPYNYIYSDNIWNLVITSKLTKHNLIPTEKDIERLKKRNRNLLKQIQYLNTKERQDLENVVNNNLLDQCFIDMKG
ncbi:MAG: hypothetical protein KAJ22_02610 [Candidatus Izimaplasma sp.]|nr:hypothetical protein [Candidatus Izimaplasma bacterium]